MNLTHLYFGFYKPAFRNEHDRIDPRCWFGHVEVWGFTEDCTWVFLDPKGAGMTVTAIHREGDVLDALERRLTACEMILLLPGQPPAFRLPLHGLMTCAAVAGNLASVRALLPSALKRKLLAKGAEVIHDESKSAERGPASSSRPEQGAAAG